MRTRRAFDYQPPSFEEAKKLSEKRGGLFDAIIKRDGPRFLKPKGGDNFIRIMPNTWVGSKHYALEVKIHRNIGPDNQSYLCLRENESSPEKNCPICEERQEMSRRKEPQKDIDTLRANTSMLVYLIDRSNEQQGPQLWGMSHRSDAEILSQSLEKRQQIYLAIAHPIDGYDVEFTREGEGLGTRYRGFKVARASSPITDNPDKMDEWLNYIEDNPIPDMLQFFSYDHIKAVLYGKAKSEDEETTTRIRDDARPAPREEVIRTAEARHEPNGQDNKPPFDVEEQRTPPRRASLNEERPAPRETPEPVERRRATLDSTDEQRKGIEELRSRLAERNR